MRPIAFQLIMTVIAVNLFTQINAQPISVIQDKVNQQFIKVVENQSPIRIIEEGNYKGFSTIDFRQSIVFPSGKSKSLPENERVIGWVKGNILTTRYDLTKEQTIAIAYKLYKNDLTQITSIFLEGNHKINVLDNGAVVISDEWELFGRTISIYNHELKKLNSTKPLDNGYSMSTFISSGEKIIGIIHVMDPSTENYYTEFDALSGNMTLLKKLTSSFLPEKIFSVDDKLVVVGNSSIVAISNGNTLWKKNVVLPNYDIVVNPINQSIYYALEDRLVKLSVEDGQEVGVLNFPDDISLRKDPTQTIRPIILKPLNNGARMALVLAETNRGVITQNSVCKSAKLLFIDDNGIVTEGQTQIPEKVSFLSLFEGTDGKLHLFIDDQETAIHE